MISGVFRGGCDRSLLHANGISESVTRLLARLRLSGCVVSRKRQKLNIWIYAGLGLEIQERDLG